MFLFWYCFDDALAKAMGYAPIGDLPFGLWLLMVFLSVAPAFGFRLLAAALSERR